MEARFLCCQRLTSSIVTDWEWWGNRNPSDVASGVIGITFGHITRGPISGSETSPQLAPWKRQAYLSIYLSSLLAWGSGPPGKHSLSQATEGL